MMSTSKSKDGSHGHDFKKPYSLTIQFNFKGMQNKHSYPIYKLVCNVSVTVAMQIR